jgi:quercetin dioxygenase-like cupin family protein
MSDPAPIARKGLLEASFVGAPAIERAHISRVELAPGQAAGLHRHPCHVIGCVLTGTIHFQIAQRPATVIAAGEAFHEPDGVWIARFDNASDSEAAVFLACYLLPPGEERLIEMAPQTH